MVVLTEDQKEKIIKGITGEDIHIQNIRILETNGTYLELGQILPVYVNEYATLYCVDLSDDYGDFCGLHLEDLAADGVVFEYVGFL